MASKCCSQILNLLTILSPNPIGSFKNCCTNDFSAQIMKTPSFMSLQTFAIMEIHKNIPLWAKRFSISTTQFILQLNLPKRLTTRLFIHFVCCDLHNETEQNRKALYLYATSVPYILSRIKVYLNIPSYDYDRFPYRTLFPKTVITYSCMDFLLEFDENWMVDIVTNNLFEPENLQNFLHKAFIVKCIPKPSIYIDQPLFMHLDYLNNALVCAEGQHIFSHRNPVSVGRIIYICA